MTPTRTDPQHDAMLAEARAQDEAVRALGMDLWVGAEPTFTRRESQEAWWLYNAEGGDKEEWGIRLLRTLAPRLDAPAQLIHALGRQFPEEDAPRFCYGALWRRDDPAPAGPAPPIQHLGEDPLPAPIVDRERAWLTVTPDPAVIEVNMAPARDLAEFLRMSRQVYAAAEEVGLSAVRYRYNGEVTDSGGGGQLTFGGPSPIHSPFFAHPGMLPGLLRYLQHHPSLSYAFAGECVGSASQGPRSDEGVPERFEELCVTLDLLAAAPLDPGGDPELLRVDLWQSLAPLLVDASGNSHRAEVNIEKLWNPHYPGRGRLGLVELRALRMQPTPEAQTAIAALFRAILARCVVAPYERPLITWGATLHDRYALPHFLAEDLREVLDDLDHHGFGLGPATREHLLRPSAEREPLLELERAGARLRVTPALEFWPLVGDVASQELSGARVVDSSTRRLQIEVFGGDPGQLFAAGRAVPLTEIGPGHHIAGLRYRAFVPSPGFLPRVEAHDPLELLWRHPDGACSRLAYYQWRPAGGAYEGLPEDAAAARERRGERFVVEAHPATPTLFHHAAGGLTVDLRRPAPEA